MKYFLIIFISIIFYNCNSRKNWFLYSNGMRGEKIALNPQRSEYKYSSNGITYDLSYGSFQNKGDTFLLNSHYDSSNITIHFSEKEIINQKGYRIKLKSKFSETRLSIFGIDGYDTIIFSGYKIDSGFHYFSTHLEGNDYLDSLYYGIRINKLLVSIRKFNYDYAPRDAISYIYNIKESNSNFFSMEILPCEFSRSFIIFNSAILTENREKEVLLHRSPGLANHSLKIKYLKKINDKEVDQMFSDYYFNNRCKE